jgi:hypothetical protein
MLSIESTITGICSGIVRAKKAKYRCMFMIVWCNFMSFSVQFEMLIHINKRLTAAILGASYVDGGQKLSFPQQLAPGL